MHIFHCLYTKSGVWSRGEKHWRFRQRMLLSAHYRLKSNPDESQKLMVDPEAGLEEELVVRPNYS